MTNNTDKHDLITDHTDNAYTVISTSLDIIDDYISNSSYIDNRSYIIVRSSYIRSQLESDPSNIPTNVRESAYNLFSAYNSYADRSICQSNTSIARTDIESELQRLTRE